MRREWRRRQSDELCIALDREIAFSGEDAA
jgi:hypothetical protein